MVYICNAEKKNEAHIGVLCKSEIFIFIYDIICCAVHSKWKWKWKRKWLQTKHMHILNVGKNGNVNKVLIKNYWIEHMYVYTM